jgi:hypothetical protein
MQQRKQERTMREEGTIIKSLKQVSLPLQLSQFSSLILFHAVASTNRKKPRPSARASQVMGSVILPDMDLDALHNRIRSNPPSNHIWEPGMIEEAHQQGIETHRNSFALLQNGEAVDGLLAEDDKAKEARGRQRSTSARESALLHPPSTKRSKPTSRPKVQIAEPRIHENICQPPTIHTASQVPDLPSSIDSSKRQKPRGDSERHSILLRDNAQEKEKLPPSSRQPAATINGKSRVRLHRRKKKER